MRHTDLQRTNLDLLLQLDRLLTEADRARVLRDHLLAVARQGMHRPSTPDAEPAPTEEAAHE